MKHLTHRVGIEGLFDPKCSMVGTEAEHNSAGGKNLARIKSSLPLMRLVLPASYHGN